MLCVVFYTFCYTCLFRCNWSSEEGTQEAVR